MFIWFHSDIQKIANQLTEHILMDHIELESATISINCVVIFAAHVSIIFRMYGIWMQKCFLCVCNHSIEVIQMGEIQLHEQLHISIFSNCAIDITNANEWNDNNRKSLTWHKIVLNSTEYSVFETRKWTN